MKGHSIVIPAVSDLKAAEWSMKDSRTEYDRPITLDELRSAVEGDIQLIPEFACMRVDGVDYEVVAFCNEEARIEGRPDNQMANHIYSRAIAVERGLTADVQIDPQWRLVGPVVVVWGDDEFMNAL